ncbi:hypothetical protein [Mycolicibacterium peregrinum]|uniref:Uncharacterized protein n=1 Tax=Mycolicibacterium peregrinum TaxID=43304 RepID=A0A4Z0HPR1_MYCPR|nr:hypothetical protein [Mycolicibacterium peregrinum]TGB41064.1 hypothetical protein EJD98_18035 [Mycolicibacterium peregrinum]TGB41290.1 hypothetical protein EJD94_17035 [Mycolicibacterium peregrinum]
MRTSVQRILRPVAVGAAAVAVVIAPTAVSGQVSTGPAEIHAEPCVNGVIPWNPYVVNCNLQPRPPRVRGSAPDAGAIIACRGRPGCLAWYINGPP